ncbi:MAG TPA: hypothetical protein VK550_10955 [Polyangiaceae bacterium]|nr:hypothetical protein [Polyangiaceae bacterium]
MKATISQRPAVDAAAIAMASAVSMTFSDEPSSIVFSPTIDDLEAVAAGAANSGYPSTSTQLPSTPTHPDELGNRCSIH